jgi:hypothetical protein
MSTDRPRGGGRGGARRPGWPRVRWRRPAGIRNGGLLLALVAAAALMALVEQPVGPGRGRPPPGTSQHLPPPVGIAQDPPAGAAQPGPSAGRGDGERPAAAARAHPRRAHPRPDQPGSVSGRAESALTPSGGPAGAGGSGGTGSGGTAPPSPPPGTTAPVQASASVRVPPARVRVTPPAVAGRQPAPVEAGTPEVSVDLPLSVPPVTLLGG